MKVMKKKAWEQVFQSFLYFVKPPIGTHSPSSPSAEIRPPNRADPNVSCPSATPRRHNRTGRRGRGCTSCCLTGETANVKGLCANVGGLPQNLVLLHRAYVVAVMETSLTGEVEPTFCKVPGYPHWVKKNRENRAGGDDLSASSKITSKT